MDNAQHDAGWQRQSITHAHPKPPRRPVTRQEHPAATTVYGHRSPTALGARGLSRLGKSWRPRGGSVGGDDPRRPSRGVRPASAVPHGSIVITLQSSRVLLLKRRYCPTCKRRRDRAGDPGGSRRGRKRGHKLGHKPIRNCDQQAAPDRMTQSIDRCRSHLSAQFRTVLSDF